MRLVAAENTQKFAWLWDIELWDIEWSVSMMK